MTTAQTPKKTGRDEDDAQAGIRPMERADLPQVVKVHRMAFRGFFLDRMGPAFLRAYYAAVLDYPGSMALVLEREGKIHGFAVGFMDPDGFYRHFRARRIRLLPAIALGLLRRPWLLGDVLGNRNRVETSADMRKPSGTAELSSIGVAAKGDGSGARLLRAFCKGMFDQGASQILLTTDEADNEAVHRFYRKHGFQAIGVEDRGNRRLTVYRLLPAG